MEGAAVQGPVDEDVTAPFSLGLLPTLERVEAALAAFPGFSVGFYNPQAPPHDPWLWLDTPRGVVKVVEAWEEPELRARFAAIREGQEADRLECPECGASSRRPAPPRGAQHCADCYRLDRRLVAMVWRGRTMRLRTIQ